MSEQNYEHGQEVQVAAFRAEIARIKDELQSVDGTLKLVDVSILDGRHMDVWLRYKSILKEIGSILQNLTGENISTYENTIKKVRDTLVTLGGLVDVLDVHDSVARFFSDWMRNRISPLYMGVNILLSQNPKVIKMIGELREDITNEIDNLHVV